jgi:hypothetical protein
MSRCQCKSWEWKKYFLHLPCENNYDGVISILFTILNFLFISFFGFTNHESYEFEWFVIIWKILCKSYMHERQERENVKACYEFDNNPMRMCFKHKI